MISNNFFSKKKIVNLTLYLTDILSVILITLYPSVNVKGVIIRESCEGRGCLLPGSHHYLIGALSASVREPTLLLPVLAPAWFSADLTSTNQGDIPSLLSLYQHSHNKKAFLKKIGNYSEKTNTV